MSKWFRVEVIDHEGQIVAIETEMLCGREIGDGERETIISAIRNLQGFIGDREHELDSLRLRVKELEKALHNVRITSTMIARRAKVGNKEYVAEKAQHLLRFCREVGIEGSVLRNET